MTKKQLVRKMVSQQVWEILKKHYRISTDEPQTKKQEDFLKGVSDYVYEEFAKKIKVDDLKMMKKDKEN